MNPFITLPATLKVFYQIMKYNKATKKKADEYRACGDFEAERELICENTGIYINRIAEILNVDFEVEGYENVPESGPIVIYANHQGFADVLVLYSVLRKFQFGFVGKDEFRSWGPVATAMNYTRSVFLKRSDPRAALDAIKQTTELLNKGFSICIFPEGTRARGPIPGEFKDGAFKFAQKAKVPVMPVTINDSFKMFEIDGSFHPCTVKIKFHPVVHIENMDRKEQKEAWESIVTTITDDIH